MDLFSIINAIVVALGVPSIILALLNIGGKLKTLEVIENDLKDNIRPDLKDVRERFFALEGKTSGLFQTASPVRLMPPGETVLADSGLKEYIDSNKKTLISGCKNGKEFSNPYDVQKAVFTFFDDFQFENSFFEGLKLYAYNRGIDINTLRRVGAIYLRDVCLEYHDMNQADIDKYDPEKKETADK